MPASKGRVGKEEEKNAWEREMGGEVGSGKEWSLDPAVEGRKGEGLGHFFFHFKHCTQFCIVGLYIARKLLAAGLCRFAPDPTEQWRQKFFLGELSPFPSILTFPFPPLPFPPLEVGPFPSFPFPTLPLSSPPFRALSSPLLSAPSLEVGRWTP